MDLPELSIDDLILSAPSVDDAQDWTAAQDDECARWFGWPCPPSPERCRTYLRDLDASPEPNSYTWAIRMPEGFAGGIDLKLDEGRWNVSYFVHRDYRGRGIARRALRAVVDWAFNHLGLDEVSTRVRDGNIASQKVLEAAGFKRVGVEQSPDAGHRDLIYVLSRPS